MQHRDVPPVSFQRRLLTDCFKQVPIRFFTVPSIVAILVVVALTDWLSWWHGQQTVSRLASQLQSADFVSQIDCNTRMTLLLCLTVAVTWMLGVMIARLSHVVRAIAGADLEKDASQSGSIQEGATDQTAQTAAALSFSFKQIEAENTHLEAQVRERTAQLCQALEFEDLLRRITEKVRDSLNESCILQTVVRELTLGLGIQGCDVSLYNLEAGISTVCYEHLCANLSPAQGRAIALDTLPAYQLLLQRQHTQFCLLEPTPGALRSEQAQFTCLACPMMDNQGVLGDLWLFKPKQQNFSLQEIRLVEQIASQCAIALRQSHLYQTAQAQVKELEQLHRVKDDFLSTVSHELRTPLANIKMGTQLLEMSLEHSGFSDTSAPIYRYLQILKDEAQREMVLINDLLDLSRLDAGLEPYVATTIDPKTWIPHVVEPFMERAQMQRQQLQLDLATDLPPLTTDLSNLERILSELLNNACKYTPAGEKIVVTVRTQMQTDGVQSTDAKLTQAETIFAYSLLGTNAANGSYSANSANPHLLFLLSVANSGVEIPKAEQNRIFDKFYRIPSDDPWQHEGTGLGLALVKGLVERLSGKVWVDSRGGVTTFTVQLPTKGLD